MFVLLALCLASGIFVHRKFFSSRKAGNYREFQSLHSREEEQMDTTYDYPDFEKDPIATAAPAVAESDSAKGAFKYDAAASPPKIAPPAGFTPTGMAQLPPPMVPMVPEMSSSAASGNVVQSAAADEGWADSW